MSITFPRFIIVGRRPVKALLDEAGNLGIYAYNWTTGEFEESYDYGPQVFWDEGDVEEYSEEFFNHKVEKLRNELRSKQ